jgi:diguanylate cyclase (GGDEF)-like protein
MPGKGQMDKPSDKEQVLGDYGALLRAGLPGAASFRCHDSDGRLFWVDGPDIPVAQRPAWEAALRRVLTDPANPASASGVDAPDRPLIHVLPLVGSAQRCLGALTVAMDDGAGLERERCEAALRPALRTLSRELDLRLRLMDSQRKLAVQAAEENLLHRVETLVHKRFGLQEIIDRTLQMCCESLRVRGAALLVPEFGIRAIRAADADHHALEHLCPDELVGDVGRADTAGDSPDRLVMPVGRTGAEALGALVLVGIGRTPFSTPRLRRVSRYVSSQFGSALERDFDPLTGLLNWPVFETYLLSAAASPDRDGHLLAYFDLDQLHVINDTFGREKGDEILAAFGALLRRRFPGQRVSRITSDSFAVLVTDGDLETLRRIAQDACRELQALSCMQGDKSLRPSVSIGIGPPAFGQAGGGLLSMAQVACQAAKDRGRGRVEVYEPDDQSIIRRFDDIQLVSEIRGAIQRNRLALVGQPIRPLAGRGGPQYFEVLVRLLDDMDAHVSPADFLSAAERYGLMEDLDRWVVSHSLQTLVRHGLGAPGGPVRLAINLSGQTLGSEGFLAFVQDQLRSSGVAPELLCFEITETVAVANMQRAQQLMRALQRLGCRFSLDDFGTGLSSFAYLKLFPVDTIKIDGSFIQDLTSNVVSQSVVAAIAEVARVMELETVAEYVQDQDALALLTDLGVTWGQGFLLGQPADLADCLAGLSDRPGRSAAGGMATGA